MEWFLTAGVGLIIVAAILDVWEEWPTRGLTDTSYKCLLMWLIGLVLIQVWSHHTVQLVDVTVLGVILDIPMAIFSYWIILKIQDHAKTYWLPSLRRHRK